MQSTKNIDLIESYLKNSGYEVERKRFGRSPHSQYAFITSPTGKNLILSASGLILPFPTSAAKYIIDDKMRSYELAAWAGLEIPETKYVDVTDTLGSDFADMLKRHGELIVKPHNSFQSRGLTTGITTLSGLKGAIKYAGNVSPTAIIQEQVDGEELRLISIDGQIKAALLRQRPRVVGDGQATVKELIEKENIVRANIDDSLVRYPLITEQIAGIELCNSQFVPPDGEIIKLNNKTMIRDGASIYDVIDSIDPSYVLMAERAARKFGRGISSVDIIIQDYTAPAKKGNYWFIEFNSAISIAMCYSCRDSKHFKILDDYIGPMLIEAIG